MLLNDIQKYRRRIQAMHKRIPDDQILGIKKEILKITDIIEREVSLRMINDEHSTGK